MERLREDRDFLNRFRRGDPSVLTEVYRALLPSVVRFLSHGFAFRSGEQALHFQGYRQSWELQNAVQETFLRAFSETARNQYDGLRPFDTYLITIARNVALDDLRSAARRLGNVSLDDLSLAESAAPELTQREDLAPDRKTEEAELRRLMERFLDDLTPAERDLVRTRFQEGLSQREAAAALGMTRMRVRLLEEKVRRKALAFFEGLGYAPNASALLALLLLTAFGSGGFR